MLKPANPRELVKDILDRSKCNVKVGAVIADSDGIFSWGWNFDGFDGYGLCAEQHAIQRANKRRLTGATIYVAGSRDRTGKPVPAKPCAVCQKLIDKWEMKVEWRDNTGDWQVER